MLLHGYSGGECKSEKFLEIELGLLGFFRLTGVVVGRSGIDCLTMCRKLTKGAVEGVAVAAKFFWQDYGANCSMGFTLCPQTQELTQLEFPQT
jgi:hypothetical protein